MPLIIIAYLIYAWTADRKTSIAGPIVALFLAGFSLMFVYSSTLAYLVDSNPGRSASAVSCNSFCRGVGACVMSQVAIPLQNAIGDGGLYTLFAGVLCFACAGLVVIACKYEYECAVRCAQNCLAGLAVRRVLFG
jgi:Na+/melibiose symporter-like transporter